MGMPNTHMRALATALGVGALACAGVPASASAAISFVAAPDVPNLPAVTLNGQAQTKTAQMANWSVSQTLLSGGWNVTVNGDSSAGHSAVFKVYCPGPSACGSDAVGYVSGGAAMAANSLTLNSTGAIFTGVGVPAPTHSCNSGCNVDSATAVKVASAGTLVAVGTATTSNYSSTSLALAIPTTLRAPLQSAEVYRVDLVWTLNSGP
jgi:hypothetical protein